MLPAGLRAIWLIWCSPCPLVTVRVDAAAQASPENTWPEDLPARETGGVGGAPAGRAGPWPPPQPRQPGGENSRECPDALGRVSNVPHLDVGGGHGEHEPRVATVLDGDHVVGVALQSRDLLPRYQVPHLTAAI